MEKCEQRSQRSLLEVHTIRESCRTELHIKFCKGFKHVYYLHLFIWVRQPQLHNKSIQVGLPESVDVSSDGPIPVASVISSDTPSNRKRKDKSYKTLATAVSAIADPAYKQQRLEMMAREDVHKEKAEAPYDAQGVRGQEHLSMEQ